jgi:hypothetical protein
MVAIIPEWMRSRLRKGSHWTQLMREFYKEKAKEHPLYIALEEDNDEKVTKAQLFDNEESFYGVGIREKTSLEISAGGEEITRLKPQKAGNLAWRVSMDNRKPKAVLAEILASVRTMRREGYNVSYLECSRAQFL